MTEEKEKKEPERIKTVQDGIFLGEKDLLRTNDPVGYKISLFDHVRREIGALPDGYATLFEKQLEKIMADEDGDEDWADKYDILMTAGLSGRYTLEDIQKVVEQRTAHRIIAKLGNLESRVARKLDELDIKPVMRERGKKLFYQAHPELKDDG